MSVLASLSLLLSACGAGSGDSASPGNIATAKSCPVNVMNAWVYEAMQDYYLFYDQVPTNMDITADIPANESPEKLIKALRVSPEDKYSYVTDEITYNAFFNEGETFGYGWNFASDEANEKWLFSLIEPNSPLADAGVQRGEELLAINGIDRQSYLQLSDAAKADIVGTGDDVKTVVLTIGSNSQSNEQTTRQVTVTKSTYSLQTVLDTQVIEHNGIQVGYLQFTQFIKNSTAELQEAFSMLETANVSELVLDLRFNGGGRISVANELASWIIGDSHTNDVFTTFAYNDKYQASNASITFKAMQDNLSLNRVFVLQSGNTCSASELVVNSLRPFIDVVTVGSTSCGKPYATSPNKACGKVANALEIELLNAAGVGDYFNGIAADCAADEDVRLSLGNPDEPLLATSLNYIGTGSCGLLASRSSRPANHRLTTEFKPAWQGGNSL